MSDRVAKLDKPISNPKTVTPSDIGGRSPQSRVDFSQPPGAEALCGPDSVSWRVFKNPVAIFIGGITAVLMEFADPRVRSGVWDHSIFKTDPLLRMTRTGLATMVTVYGPKEKAEALIAGITRKHERVKGTTPDGTPYEALDPVLMDWVQATVSFGFMHAYHSYVHELTPKERTLGYEEFVPASLLFGAPNPPRSDENFKMMMQTLEPGFESSPIVFEFLDIVQSKAVMPTLLKPLQKMMVRGAIDILPLTIRETLNLGKEYDLKPHERKLIKLAGRLTDKMVIKSAPPAQACLRMGLPVDYLYKRKS